MNNIESKHNRIRRNKRRNEVADRRLTQARKYFQICGEDWNMLDL